MLASIGTLFVSRWIIWMWVTNLDANRSVLLDHTAYRNTKRGEHVQVLRWLPQNCREVSQSHVWVYVCNAFCKIPARGLMSLVGVLVTWSFHKSCRWKSTRRLQGWCLKPALVLKNCLSISDLKKHCCFASVIFGVSVLWSLFWSNHDWAPQWKHYTNHHEVGDNLLN